MKALSLPLLLSVNAGFVDTAGFLALQGLFTAHVTGNFVTLGAALVLGTSGIVAKLIALPMFVVFVGLSRLIGFGLTARGRQPLPTLLALKLALLVVVWLLAIGLGPFPNGDAMPALITGMVAVAAMAIQNAVQRLHLGTAPPTTLMTGNTTQIVIDIVDLAHGLDPAPAALARARLSKMAGSVAGFALGCALGAILIDTIHMWAFALPPAVALMALWAERAGRSTPVMAR